MICRQAPVLLALIFGVLVGPALAASGIEGKWKALWDTEGGPRTNQWTITDSDGSITVEIDGNQFKGRFADNEFAFEGTFHSPEAGYSSKLAVKGKLEAGQLKGSGTWGQYSMTFVAKRPE